MTTARVEGASGGAAEGSRPTSGELPWWKKTGPVAVVTSILAATVPGTTAVWGLVQKDREMAAKKADQAHEEAMEELKLKHTIQMDFLDRLKNDDERLRTLRMVAATNEDPKMIQWANDEKTLIDKPMRELQAEIDVQTAKAERARAELESSVKAGKKKEGQIAELRANAAKQAQELSFLKAAQVVAEAKRHSAAEVPQAASGQPATRVDDGQRLRENCKAAFNECVNRVSHIGADCRAPYAECLRAITDAYAVGALRDGSK
jgi:hypothetical protein